MTLAESRMRLLYVREAFPVRVPFFRKGKPTHQRPPDSLPQATL